MPLMTSMLSRCFRPAVTTLLFASLAGGLMAQESKRPPPPPVPVGQERPTAKAAPDGGDRPAARASGFPALVADLDRRLDQAPSWTLNAVTRWTRETAGQPAVSGVNRVEVRGAGLARYRVEVRVEEDAEPTLVHVADGRTLERVHLPGKLFAVRTTSRPLGELGSDPLLVSMLEGTGLDYILREDRTATIIDRVTSLTEIPSADKGRTYQLETNTGRTMTVRFTEGPTPTIASVRSALGDPKTGAFRSETDYTWSFPAGPAERDFQPQQNVQSIETSSLHLGLLGEDARLKLGQPVPPLRLIGLARGADPGGDLVIDPAGGATVLFFWAEWCAPSLEAMPTVNEFISRWKKKGVRFVAVNVGQSAAEVDEFLKTRGAEFPGRVALDPEGKSLAALGLSQVPAAVVIGSDGKLAAVYSGPTDEIRAELRGELPKLLGDQ